jgi:hypothetical protein
MWEPSESQMTDQDLARRRIDKLPTSGEIDGPPLRFAEYYDSVVLKWKSWLALGLFICGFVSFVIFFTIASHPKYLALSGWTVWTFAYFSVLAQQFRKKAPIFTRGGIVRYQNRPRLYRLIYGFLFFLGGFALLVIFLVNLPPQ